MSKNRGLGRFVDYMGLKNVGLLEMMVALLPMLGGFDLAFIPMSIVLCVLAIIITIIKGHPFKGANFYPLLYFIIYWVFHEFCMVFFDDVNFNGLIARILFFVFILAVYPSLDLNKFKGSLNWVVIISIIGLLYQWGIIVSGGGVHPLEIPGLTMSAHRLETETFRPSSFYMEPAAFVAFMICPLFFSLIEKKYLLSIAIILSIFLSTSTTGLIVSFIMLGTSFMVGQRIRITNLLTILLIGFSLLYVVTSFDAFSLTIDKFNKTDVESEVRLAQGPYIVSTMQFGEYIFGVPYATPYSYCMSRGVQNVDYLGDSVFMPTFWMLILKNGIIGLLLYLNIYWRIYKKNRQTIPLVAALIAVMFSSGYYIGTSFGFSLIVLLVFIKNTPTYYTHNK